MVRFKRTIIPALAVLAAVLAPAASGAVRITKIYYDSPGKDTRSNRSLNAEWVRLKNTGRRTRQLTGWSIRDAAGHAYIFVGPRLRPGRTITLHTGRGTDTTAHRYWWSGNYIWNNDKDTARLYRPSGRLADRCHYRDPGPSASSTTC